MTSTTPSGRCAFRRSALRRAAVPRGERQDSRARIGARYNDWMIDEWCGPSHGRLIPLCLVPLWDPVLAAAEVRRNAARGCHAVAFTELPANLGLPSLHDADRHWDPFLAACDETRTTINMHIGSARAPTTSADAPQASHPLTRSCYMAWPLLLSGVLRVSRTSRSRSPKARGLMPFFLLYRLVTSHKSKRGQSDPRSPTSRELRARPRVRLLLRRHGSRCASPDRIVQLVSDRLSHQDSTCLPSSRARSGAVTPPELEMRSHERHRHAHLDPAIFAMIRPAARRDELRLVFRKAASVDSAAGSYRVPPRLVLSESHLTIGPSAERGREPTSPGPMATDHAGFPSTATPPRAQVFWDPLARTPAARRHYRRSWATAASPRPRAPDARPRSAQPRTARDISGPHGRGHRWS